VDPDPTFLVKANTDPDPGEKITFAYSSSTKILNLILKQICLIQPYNYN